MAQLRKLTREISYQPIPLYRDHNSSQAIKLDLNALCIKRPTETFFIHVKNPKLVAWGIGTGDLLVVERGEQFLVNDLLVLEKKGEYKFYQFFSQIDGEKILFSLDADEPNLRIRHWQEINIAGIITNVVHQIRQRTTQRYAA